MDFANEIYVKELKKKTFCFHKYNVMIIFIRKKKTCRTKFVRNLNHLTSIKKKTHWISYPCVLLRIPT